MANITTFFFQMQGACIWKCLRYKSSLQKDDFEANMSITVGSKHQVKDLFSNETYTEIKIEKLSLAIVFTYFLKQLI